MPANDELCDLAGVELVKIDGAAMAHLTTAGNARLVEMLQRPSNVNAVVALLCVKGGLEVISHDSTYHLDEGQIFLSLASVLQFRNIDDSEFYLLVFGPDFLTSMNLNLGFMVDMMATLHSGARLLDVDARTMTDIGRMYKELYENHNASEKNIYVELSLRHLFCSMIYRIYDIVARVGTRVSQSRLGVKDRSAEYFERLLHLLAENFREQRSVEFYADKMNISSKHLSRVIRSFTGKSVHQWIDDFVALEIKNLLRYSDMSIQQISYALNFPNPSFMGQYFKRITGMTPGEYKRG